MTPANPNSSSTSSNDESSAPPARPISGAFLRTSWVWPFLVLVVVVAAPVITNPPQLIAQAASRIAALNSQRTENSETYQDPNDESPDAADLEPGREVRLNMQGGKIFRGEFVSQDRLNIVIKIAGIATTFERQKIIRITPLKTFDEQYRNLKIAISRQDYLGRLELCQWLYGRKRYQFAAEELESLLDDTEDLPEARTLLRSVNRAIAIFGPDGSSERSAEDAEQTAADVEAANPTHFVEGTLLTESQINLLRIYEVELKNPPRMIVSRDTIDRLCDRFAESDLIPKTDSAKRKLYARKPVEILELMFELQAREFYGEIRVLSEPEAFIRFRRDVQRTWLTNSCATSRCHGGTEAGDFYLFNKWTNHRRTVYTNFLILERSKVDGKPLLDYERPAESRLLQMGLSRNQTIYPHPEVPGWRPVFRDRADPIFQKAVDWLNAMYRPRPDYPVEYEMPKIRPSPVDSDGQQSEGEPEIKSGTALDEKSGPVDSNGKGG